MNHFECCAKRMQEVGRGVLVQRWVRCPYVSLFVRQEKLSVLPRASGRRIVLRAEEDLNPLTVRPHRRRRGRRPVEAQRQRHYVGQTWQGSFERLDRCQILQENMRLKAFAEIYTMHSFAPFSNLNFFVKNRQKCFAIELMNFINSIATNSNFAFFLRIFDEFLSGFRAKFQKIVTCVAFSIKFAKTNQKFAENSELCEKKSLLLVNYIHFTP